MDNTLTNPNKMNAFIDMLNSDEGKTYIKDFLKKKEIEDRIISSQCEWFHKKSLNYRIQFIEAVKNFYKTDKYKDRWFNRCIEPPTELFWMYYEYAKRYGEDAYNIVADNPDCFMFTTFLYKTPEGYYVERMDGQGSIVNVMSEQELQDLLKSH